VEAIMHNKVVIFGGGFVGSKLCPLFQKNYKLTVVDTFWFWDSVDEYRESTGVDCKIIQEDVRSKDIGKIIQDNDIVINLACLSNDTSSDIDSAFTHDVSYNGVINVLSNSINKRLIQTSSTSVYGVKGGGLVDESDTPEPITQYSKIKAEIDNYLSYYIKYKNSHITILRPATLYGFSPRLRLDVMVNTLLNRAFKDNKLLIEGGKQFRPCLHVDDLCNTFLKCIQNSKSCGNIYNVTNENYSVNQIVEIIKDAVPDVELHYQHVIDQRSYQTSSKKIVNDLGIEFTTKLNKKTITELYEKICSRNYNTDKTINLNVIKRLLDG
jgi:nucleoside-diphosphate-sugar epimerase